MTKLKDILAFVVVPAGLPGVSLAHGLNWNGRAVIPDTLTPDVSGFTITADATNVTVINNGAAAATVNVLVQSWHTEERAFGSDAVTALAPQPFVSGPGGVPAGLGTGITALYSGTLNVYVDAVGGSDANDGLTAGTALQTISAVYQRFPWYAVGSGKIVVNLADDGAGGVATYGIDHLLVGGGHANMASYQYIGPAMVAFAPATGPSVAALDAVTPATRVDVTGAGSGSGRRTKLNFTTAAPGWTVNDLKGKFARIMRGANQVVFEAPISRNDADAIYVDDERVTTAVAAADTVTIVTPGAQIRGTSASFLLSISGQGIGNYYGVLLSTTPDPFMFRRIGFPNHMQVHNVGGAYFDRCLFGALFFFHQCELAFSNCCGRNTIGMWCSSQEVSPAPIGTVLTATAFVDLVRVSGSQGIQSTLSTLIQTRYSCWDVTNYGVLARGGRVLMQTITQGAGNTKTGFCVSENAVIEVPATATDRPLTGTAGFARLRATALTVADGTGAGQFDEGAGYAGNFTQKNAGTAAAPVGDASRITDIPSSS